MKKLIIAVATLTLGANLMAETTMGRGDGYLGEIVVKVEREGETITSIQVTDHSDSPRIANKAFANLTKSILETQSVDVDIVAGATYSSKGFLKAVEDALYK